MARFTIADISDARSILQELRAVLPELPSVPVQPIITSYTGRTWDVRSYSSLPLVASRPPLSYDRAITRRHQRSGNRSRGSHAPGSPVNAPATVEDKTRRGVGQTSSLCSRGIKFARGRRNTNASVTPNISISIAPQAVRHRGPLTPRTDPAPKSCHPAPDSCSPASPAPPPVPRSAARI